ncbi:ABC transporter permease [Candidatus Spongiihabitans sp.]|uniref:ABC transporter permease n=1 Tax=Candidatus Spongiihabitans sp. TaxID=3101308 RepID=UPI003C7E65DD
MRDAAVISIIPLSHLAVAFMPALLVIALFYWWQLKIGSVVYAFVRMLVQLLLVGYFLLWIFNADQAWIVLILLLAMVAISSWISLRTVTRHRTALYLTALVSIAIGGGVALALVTQIVLETDPWFRANTLIPLAGMIFSNSMNGVSLAADRLIIELKSSADYRIARNAALHTALIPMINSLFAVGLVALPGMMTGQILSGVSPLIAARYQIMVMCMLFGAAGLSTILFLALSQKYWANQTDLFKKSPNG